MPIFDLIAVCISFMTLVGIWYFVAWFVEIPAWFRYTIAVLWTLWIVVVTLPFFKPYL